MAAVREDWIRAGKICYLTMTKILISTLKKSLRSTLIFSPRISSCKRAIKIHWVAYRTWEYMRSMIGSPARTFYFED